VDAACTEVLEKPAASISRGVLICDVNVVLLTWRVRWAGHVAPARRWPLWNVHREIGCSSSPNWPRAWGKTEQRPVAGEQCCTVLYRTVTVQRVVVRYVTPCTLICTSVSYLLPPSSGFQAHGGSRFFRKGSTYLGGTCRHGSRDSSVGIPTAYGLDSPGIESRWGEIFRTRSGRP